MVICFPTSTNWPLSNVVLMICRSPTTCCLIFQYCWPATHIYDVAWLHKYCTVISLVYFFWAAKAIAVKEIKFCTAATELCCTPCAAVRWCVVLLKEKDSIHGVLDNNWHFTDLLRYLTNKEAWFSTNQVIIWTFKCLMFVDKAIYNV